MKYLPIALSVSRQTQAGKIQLEPASYADLKKKILQRDQNICQCCGFKSQKYQDIHFVNGDQQDTSDENVKTVCIFCHQCFNLDQVNKMRSGLLIWLPEISQVDLHHITRAIYIARISQGPIANAARTAYDELMRRKDVVRERIGTDDPHILATVLQDYLTPGHYKRRIEKLDGVRLLPLDRRLIKEADLEFNQFPQILAYWRSKDGPFGGKVPQKWFDIYHQVQAA